MKAADFRRIALSMPNAFEGSHFGVADFRTGAGRIFATLAYEKKGSGVLMLTQDQQAGMVADAPEMFSPVPNTWGKQGATLVHLAAVTPDVLEGAIRTAWLTVDSKASAKKRTATQKKATRKKKAAL